MKKKTITIVVSGLCFSLFIIFLFFNYALHPREYIERLDFDNGSVVKVVYDLREDIYFFIDSKWLLPNTCLYWTMGGPNFSWGKYDNETLYIDDKSAQPTYVNLSNPFGGDRCTCKNDYGIEYEYCRSPLF